MVDVVGHATASAVILVIFDRRFKLSSYKSVLQIFEISIPCAVWEHTISGDL